jgi:hypothetical protein
MALSNNKNNKNNKKNNTILYKDFDINKLIIKNLEDTKYNVAQKIAMLKYKHSNYDTICLLQTPNIELFTYGIPRPASWYLTDKSRSFIKVPEDVNNPNCVHFFKKLEEIDNMLQSETFKEKIFGSKKVAELYKYQPIVREPEELNNPLRPRYIKVNIDIDYNTQQIKSKCYIPENKEDDDHKNTKNSKLALELVNDIENIDDFAKYVKYQSTICMVICINKLYASKNKVNGEIRKYGITFKLHQVLCEAPTKNYNDINNNAFIDTDEIDNNNPLINVKIKKELHNLVDNATVLDEDCDEDEDEDEEENEEED